MRAFRSQPGYLLVELIAAVTLSAIAVAALIPAVSGRSEQTRRSELIMRITDFDRRVRLLGLQEGPVRLELGSTRELTASVARGGEPTLRLRLDAGEVHLMDPEKGTQTNFVVFDRLGRSADYIMFLRTRGSRLSIHVNGLTGRATLNSEEPNP